MEVESPLLPAIGPCEPGMLPAESSSKHFEDTKIGSVVSPGVLTASDSPPPHMMVPYASGMPPVAGCSTHYEQKKKSSSLSHGIPTETYWLPPAVIRFRFGTPKAEAFSVNYLHMDNR